MPHFSIIPKYSILCTSFKIFYPKLVKPQMYGSLKVSDNILYDIVKDV